MKQNTLLYKNISLILFSKGGSQFVVSLSDKRRDIYSERRLLLAPSCTNACTPLQAVSSEKTLMPLIGCVIPGSTLDSDWTACLNLTTWFSYHMVSFRLHTCSTGLPNALPSPCLLITTHTESPNKLYIIFFSNIMISIVSEEKNRDTFTNCYISLSHAHNYGTEDSIIR